MDPDARAVVSRVGQGGQPGRGSPVQRGQGVDAGGGDVMHRPGLDPRDPQREPVRGDDRLDVAAMGMGFAGVPQVNGLAADAEGLLPAPVGRDDRAVQDHVRQAFLAGLVQGLAQIGSLTGQDHDHLVEVAVGGSPRDAMVTGQCVGGGPVAEPAQPQHRLPEAGQRPAGPSGVPALPALGCQQPRGELSEFPRDVNRGTIGDHAGPSSGSRSCG